MVHDHLKIQDQNMTITQFCAECISMFGLHAKSQKVKPSMNSISTSGVPGEQQTYSQIEVRKKKKKLQAEMELIQQQRKEIKKPEGCTSHQSRPATVSKCHFAGYVLPVYGQ